MFGNVHYSFDTKWINKDHFSDTLYIIRHEMEYLQVYLQNYLALQHYSINCENMLVLPIQDVFTPQVYTE